MKTLKLLSLLAIIVIFSSCGDDDGPNIQPIEADLVENLPAVITNIPMPGLPAPEEGSFTKFDFATGQTTTSDTEWDIAFRSTAIIVNGGESSGANDEPARNGNAAAYYVDSPFQDVNTVDTALFLQDTQSSYAIVRQGGEGWYNYSGFGSILIDCNVDNIISPISGRTLVFRTRDGRYAKVQVLSYYQNKPIRITTCTYTRR